MTDEEDQRKDELEQEGKFADWTKRHFQAFIRGCEAYGRHAYDKIATELPDKSLEEVIDYGKTFWTRYTEIEGRWSSSRFTCRVLTLDLLCRLGEAGQEDR